MLAQYLSIPKQLTIAKKMLKNMNHFKHQRQNSVKFVDSKLLGFKYVYIYLRTIMSQCVNTKFTADVSENNYLELTMSSYKFIHTSTDF
jgi:hypothetical protein